MPEQPEVLLVDPKEVIVLERHRKVFAEGPLQRLADSIKEYGQLQPGVCERTTEGKLVLRCGERRLRACVLAETLFTTTIKSDITEIEGQIFELIENLDRENLTWQEEVIAKKKLQNLLVAQSEYIGPESQRPTTSLVAELLNKDLSRTSTDIQLANWAEASEEVAKAPTKKEAFKIIKRIRGEVQRSSLLIKAIEKDRGLRTDGEYLPETKAFGEDEDEDEDTTTAAPKPRNLSRLIEARLVEYSKRFHNGKMEDILLELEPESFDLVIWDPPWHVGFDTKRDVTATRLAYNDDEIAWEEKFPGWLELVASRMALNSHLYLFFGIVNHGKVYDCLEANGFVVDRIPLIWYKLSAHSVRNPLVWPGRSYEPIAYARRGSKDLVRQGAPNVIPTPPTPPGLRLVHPSAKHPILMRDLLVRSGSPGDRILDPMAGSASVGLAAEDLYGTLALDWTLIEEKKEFYEAGMFNLVQGYNSVLAARDSVPSSFDGLIPGTVEWKQYWQSHPEEQDQMLLYARQRKGDL